MSSTRSSPPSARKRRFIIIIETLTPPAEVLCDAQWITTADATPPAGRRPAYEFRRTLSLAEQPERAWLTVTAHGVYEAFLNGRRVGDEQLTPGITSYRRTLQVQRYDVNELLELGENELVIIVSDGWFRGRTGAHRVPDSFGTEIAVIATLDVETPTGTVHLRTDSDWLCGVGAIVAADLMDGQTTDLRRLGATEWVPVLPASDPLTADRSRLRWPAGPAVRKREEYPAVSVSRLPSGRQIIDFGQNLNGWVSLSALGPVGTIITLTHGETLDADGDLTLSHLDITVMPGLPPLPVGQTDTVISRGVPTDVFEPRHTSHGFRYVAIDGLDADLDPADITAHQVRSDLTHTGTFASSSDDLNALHRIAVASWRANTLDIPTDCPQRERWGYTGDFQIFARSAAYLDDISRFAAKWLRSLADDQQSNGKITNVAPNCGIEPEPVLPMSFDGSAGWGDAATIVPWELYRAYGDTANLAEHLPMMRRWVDYAAHVAETERHASRAASEPMPHERYLWDSGFHWGEWLEPDVSFNPQRDPGIVATAYLAHSARIVSDSARALGDHNTADTYALLADRVTDAWRREFLREGQLTTPTQANHARALAFGLIPDNLVARVADALVQLIEENGTHLATGFLSTGMLLPVLADHGYADVAYNLLFQREEPGWLVMIERGATTVWESWNGVDAQGRPHESLNHYSKGAVITFLHEYVAGIRPLAPGYARVGIRPRLDNRITWAEGALDTVRGRVSSRWAINGNRVTITVSIPSGTSALVELPDGSTHEVGAGDHIWRVARPQSSTRTPYADRRAQREPVISAPNVTWTGWIHPTETPFGELLDSADSRAVLERFLPGISNSPMIEMARSIPAETVLAMASSALEDQSASSLYAELAAL